MSKYDGMACTVNPHCMRERKLENIKATDSPKKVMIIGGGPAGMEAAKVLAERGHKVTLCEKTDKLGGQWNVVATEKNQYAYYDVINRITRDMEKSRCRNQVQLQCDGRGCNQGRARQGHHGNGRFPPHTACPRI